MSAAGLRALKIAPAGRCNIIEKLGGGRFLATSPDVPGLVAYVRSVAEAAEIAQHLARKIAESCIAHGDPLPPALTHLDEPETVIDLLVPASVP